MKVCANRSAARIGMSAMLLATGSFIPGIAYADPAAPAAAEATKTSDDGQIKEIIVTAQRRSEPLSKVPIAVTAITPDQLRTAGIGSTIDLPRVTPGLTVGSSTQANAYFTPVLRGVGALTPATGNDNSVALYVDGIYQSDKTASNLDLAALSQIEVLKGPQGTLFGRNATGGAITVTTRGPTSKTEVDAETSYGNLHKWTARLFVGTPLTDTLGISLAYLHRQGGDYENYTNPLYSSLGKFGGTTVDAVQGKLVWQPTNFEAIASFIYYDRQYTDLNPVSPVPGTKPIGVQLGGTAGFDRYTYTGQPDYGTVSDYQGSLKLRYSLPGFDVVSLTGYVKAHTTQGLDYNGTSLDLFYFRNNLHIDDVSQELQILTTGSGPLQATAGGYYYRGLPSGTLNIIQGAPATVTNTAGFTDTLNYSGASVTYINNAGPVHAKAVYGQATYDLGGNTKVTAGLRYSSENRSYNYTLQGIGTLAPGFTVPVLVPLGAAQLPTVTANKVTWRFALDHQFTGDILGYVSYNRGFKSGVYNFSDFTPTQVAVKPEVLDAVEAGIKSKFFGHTLQVNAAAFYYNYKNLQVSSITAGTTSTQTLQNAGQETIYGIDGDILVRPTPDLTLRANGAYLHTRFGTNADGTTLVLSGFLIDHNGVPYAAPITATGTQGLGAPTISFTLGGDYTLHLGAAKVVLTADYFHTSSFKTVVGDGNIVWAYDRVNAAATWYLPGDRFYVRVYGQNLTNLEQIGTGTSPFRLGKAEVEPRTYGVALGFKL